MSVLGITARGVMFLSLPCQQSSPSKFFFPIMSSVCYNPTANISLYFVEYLSWVSSRGKFFREVRPSSCSGDTIVFFVVGMHFSPPFDAGTESPRFLSRTPALDFLPYCRDLRELDINRDKCCKREGCDV